MSVLTDVFDPLSDLFVAQSARPAEVHTINLRTLTPFQRALLVRLVEQLPGAQLLADTIGLADPGALQALLLAGGGGQSRTLFNAFAQGQDANTDLSLLPFSRALQGLGGGGGVESIKVRVIG